METPPISSLGVSSVDVLRGVLRRGFNENQLVILRELCSYDYRSLTHALRSISRKYGIPLSTLKTNTKILKELGIIEINKGKTPKITQIGKVVLELINVRPINNVGLDYRVVKGLSEKIRLARDYIRKTITESYVEYSEDSLSVMDVLITLYLYRGYGVGDRRLSLRDKLVVSRRYVNPTLYTVLTVVGLVPDDGVLSFKGFEELIQKYSEVGIPGIDFISQSLSHGLLVGCGMALALKRDGIPAKVYVVGGSEDLVDERLWEAVSIASRLGLDNLVLITVGDRRLVGDSILRWYISGWHVVSVEGHNHTELLRALNEVDTVRSPSVITIYTSNNKEVLTNEYELSAYDKVLYE
jgi:transketolase